MRKWEARSELEMDVCNGCLVLWHCVDFLYGTVSYSLP
jgi:hypothetical protein